MFSIYQVIKPKRINGTIALLCLLVSPCSIAVELPDLHNNQDLISPQQEQTIGRLVAGKLNQLPESHALAPKLWLQDLIQPLVNHSQLNDQPLDIFLIHNNSINAFATPGSLIGVYSGLILTIDDVEEFSAVLAHEIAHISQRHYAYRRAEQQQNSPAYLAAFIASLLVATQVDGDLGYAGIQATLTALTHQTMAHSRAHEQEADRIGMDLMQASGLDGQKMLNMLNHLDSPLVQQDPKWAWARSHPIATQRMADLTLRLQNSNSQGQFPTQYQTDFMLLRLLLQSQLLDTTVANITSIAQTIDNTDTQQALYNQFAQGLIYEQQKQWPAAQTTFAQLSEQYPYNTLIWDRWMHSLSQQNRHQDLINQAQQRLDIAISQDLAHYYLSTSYASLKDMPNAFLHLKKLIASQPNWIGGWTLMAEWTAQVGDLTEHRLAKARWHLLRAEADAAKQQLLILPTSDTLTPQQENTAQALNQAIDLLQNLKL